MASTPKVFFSSYRPPKNQEKSPGQFRQLLVVGAVILGGYFLTRLPVFQVENVEVTGTQSKSIIEKLNSIKGTSLLSAQVNEKIEEVKSDNLEILDLHCDKGIPNTLRCSVELRQTSFVWQSGNKNYLVDKLGYAYKVSQENSDKPLIIDRKKLNVDLGDRLISEDIISVLGSIKSGLEKEGIEIDSYFVNASVLQPGVVVSKRKDNLPFPKHKIDVLFSASYPVDIQTRLLTQLLKKDAKKITKQIDLRTAGYIYYK